MNRFDEIRFKGDFRSYQQRVLSNVDKYLKDGKINIVATPGSGKNILGLELICRLGEPCLILSPTKDSRDQWGRRLKEHFLKEERKFDKIFSTDIHSPRIINAITYETLSMEMEQISEKTGEELFYFEMDILKILHKTGVKTLCLEEPHHLEKDWQKALEKLLESMDEKITLICLSAIPPYDLGQTEWNKYYKICGEIDEEIFVSELVAQGDLCPHQDYVYFNFASSKEPEESFTSTVGKLKCISDITSQEHQNLGKDLRLLILTDSHGGSNENLIKIGTGESFQELSMVSIFETLRRLDDTMNIGVLFESFIILPRELVSQGTMVNIEPFVGTRYAKVDVYGMSREGMDLVRELLQSGKLQVLIGTNELPEAGWEAPCMNTLILVNSVESFTFYIQMRGLVTKGDSQNPDKNANIWHLVTMVPKANATGQEVEYIPGDDYNMVKRCLDTFMTPHYETGNIQNGMDCFSLTQPTFDEKGIVEINKGMLEWSKDRGSMGKALKNQLVEAPFQVVVESVWSQEHWAPVFSCLKDSIVKRMKEFRSEVLFWCLELLGTAIVGVVTYRWLKWQAWVLFIFMLMFFLSYMPDDIKDELLPNYRVLKKLSRRGSVIDGLEIFAQNVGKTLIECGIVSPGSVVVVEEKDPANGLVGIQLQNATRYEQGIFHKAIGELLAPIEEPQYLMVPKNICWDDKYKCSLPCPSIIGQKEEYVKILEKYLAEDLYFTELVDTTTGDGRVLLNGCREHYASKGHGEAAPKEVALPTDYKYIVVSETPTQLLEDKET